MGINEYVKLGDTIDILKYGARNSGDCSMVLILIDDMHDYLTIPTVEQEISRMKRLYNDRISKHENRLAQAQNKPLSNDDRVGATCGTKEWKN